MLNRFLTNKQLHGELARFLVAGCSAVATDFLVYYALIYQSDLSFAVAKTISFISGSIVAYLINKFWTFKQVTHSNAEIIRFIILYTSTLGANVMVNHLSLALFPTLISLAFLLATGTSTVLNFIGQKLWVFKQA